MKKLIFLLILFVNPNGLFSQWNLNNYEWGEPYDNKIDITLYFTVNNSDSFKKFVSSSDNVLIDKNNYQFDAVDYSGNLPIILFQNGKIDCWVKYSIPVNSVNIKVYNGKYSLLVTEGYLADKNKAINEMQKEKEQAIENNLMQVEEFIELNDFKNAFELLYNTVLFYRGNLNYLNDSKKIINLIFINAELSLKYQEYDKAESSLYLLEYFLRNDDFNNSINLRDSLLCELVEIHIQKRDSLFQISRYNESKYEYERAYSLSLKLDKLHDNDSKKIINLIFINAELSLKYQEYDKAESSLYLLEYFLRNDDFDNSINLRDSLLGELVEIHIQKGDSLFQISRYNESKYEYQRAYSLSLKLDTLHDKVKDKIRNYMKNNRDRFIDRNTVIINNYKLIIKEPDEGSSKMCSICIYDSINIEVFNSETDLDFENKCFYYSLDDDNILTIDLDNDGLDEAIVNLHGDNLDSFIFDFKNGVHLIKYEGISDKEKWFELSDIIFDNNLPKLVMASYIPGPSDENYPYYFVMKCENKKIKIENSKTLAIEFIKKASDNLVFLENKINEVKYLKCNDDYKLEDKKYLLEAFVIQEYLLHDFKKGIEMFDNNYDCPDKEIIKKNILKEIAISCWGLNKISPARMTK